MLRQGERVLTRTQRPVHPGHGWMEFRTGWRNPPSGPLALCFTCTASSRTRTSIALADARLLLPAESMPPLAPVAVRPATRPAPEPLPAEGPLFAVLMPVHDPEPAHLEAALASLQSQTFTRWHACLRDDGSRDPRVRDLLDRFAAADRRITVSRADEAQGISAATNAALARADAPFVVLVDHDDVISPDALDCVAARLDEDPGLDMLYSDEDRVSEDGHHHSHLFLKPGWSPELLESAMYTCHLGTYRRRVVEDLGGFRSEFDGSQDYDLVLRLSESTTRIGHVPRVLYSWRMHERSTANNFIAKPEATPRACRALDAHFGRVGVEAETEVGAVPGWYRVRHAVDKWTRLAVLMPLAAAPCDPAERAGFVTAMTSWSLGDRPGTEILLAGQPAAIAASVEPLSDREIEGAQIRFCPDAGARSWPERVNAAARESDAELLLIAPAVIAATGEAWWETMLGFARRSGIAAAGGTLTGPRGEVARGGVVFGDGWPLPVAEGRREGFAYQFLYGNFRALGGPVVMQHDVFEELGGLDPVHGDLAVVDLCLRAGLRGLRSVLCTEATFTPALGLPPAPAPALIAAFRERWRSLGADPYFNPSYWQARGDFIPAQESPARN
jgi:GT2 family glycosyltransferase